MAKRTTSATRSAPKVASRKSDSKKLGEALGEEMQRVKEHPGMTPQSSTPLDMAQDVTSVSVDMISQRAYEIWKKEGGTDLENWLKAERELRGQNIAAT